VDPDDREFMRQLLLRHEKATDAMIRRLDENTRRLDENTRQMREDHALFVRRVEKGTREFVAEMRAQRAALFRILDRLDGGGATAGA
jgi:hypothetical protein